MKRNKNVIVRVSETEKRVFDRWAEIENSTLSELIRNMLFPVASQVVTNTTLKYGDLVMFTSYEKYRETDKKVYPKVRLGKYIGQTIDITCSEATMYICYDPEDMRLYYSISEPNYCNEYIFKELKKIQKSEGRIDQSCWNELYMGQYLRGDE